MAAFRASGHKLLFRGERIAKGCHTCDHCGREIGPGERQWVRVDLYLVPDGGNRREVVVRRSCCRMV